MKKRSTTEWQIAPIPPAPWWGSGSPRHQETTEAAPPIEGMTMAQKTFVGVYREHGTHIERHFRRTAVSRRNYTHAIIPYYTTRTRFVPSPQHNGLTVPIEEPCEPWYGKPQFCSSLALAQKKCKPGWLVVEVHEQIR